MAAVCLAATLASATLLAAPVGLPATELGRLTRRAGEVACYVVEVCPACK